MKKWREAIFKGRIFKAKGAHLENAPATPQERT